ncbi:hypothetical protein HH308_20125 [Gordonia sp. TBRC 11910]|uniref:Uncharacterized protein n=1 Tax=Gordonia asplenii TaxID=2725283 RepID=A0A848KZE9_9ACTN|nr:hypothetical protein [Gordonia asplenii]NMO03527.1 hypothetical protein [Gordonia asplenii]
MTELSKKEMEEILLVHEIAELEMDVEATLATLAPNPHYELASLGLAIDGIDAVRETYRRILPNQSRDVAAEKRVHAVASNTLLREAHMSFNNLDGERVNGLYLVVMAFDPALKLISGERMYMDPNFGKMMSEQLGPDFESLPGVSRIDASAPTIAKHDAYKYAEAAGKTIDPTRAAS